MPESNNCVCPSFDQVLGGILGGSFSGTSSSDAGGRLHRVPNIFAGHDGRATLFVSVICEPWNTALMVGRYIGRPQARHHSGARQRMEPGQNGREVQLLCPVTVKSIICGPRSPTSRHSEEGAVRQVLQMLETGGSPCDG